jgi:hypothetical protein
MQITLSNVDALQAQALARLTLLVMGQTHRLFGEFEDWLIGQVNRHIDSDGFVDGAVLISGFSTIDDRYRRAVQQWVKMFEQARVQAASIPFGALVVKHNAYMGSLTEALTAENINTVTQLWQRRRQRALQAAQERVYGDGLRLSQRIWRLENGGLQNIRSTLATAMAERTNAKDLANRLEALLGADQDMPRWTDDRLYSMTPAQRAASREGLLTGTETRAQGIAYNALRLARTELQYANHAVTTEIAKHAPWVTGRFVRLSPGHPKIDVCDTLAAGGPYPKDSDLLPAHVQCMCYYEEQVMSKGVFKSQVSDWMAGESDFLDDYRDWLGVQQVTEPLPTDMSVAESLNLWLSVGRGAQAAALNLN